MNWIQRFFVFMFLISCWGSAFSQNELENQNLTHVDYIRSVQFYPEWDSPSSANPDGIFQLQLGYPIINLNSPIRLFLSFDDLSDEVKNYVYEIKHCNADWQPSDLSENEFLNGFPEDILRDFEFSYNTLTPYVHYYLAIPNNNVRFRVSGNYLLKVYEDEDEKRLVITRRFMVVEPIMQIVPDVVRPTMVSKSETHHEIDFQVNFPKVNVRNPLRELKAVVLQNGHWQRAIQDVSPLFVRGESAVFDFQDKVVFEALKEFRFVDLRSFRYPSGSVGNLQRYPDGIDIVIKPDRKRVKIAYFERQDINGNFVIDTQDGREPDLEGDYGLVEFTLVTPTPYYQADVYLYGALTEWKIKPEFKLRYNERMSAYVGEAYLKQGFHEYLYAVVPEGTQEPDFRDTEGNWFETENQYTILVYYRPFGGRYDRLVASHTFSSREY
jgi:hypothetical protein